MSPIRNTLRNQDINKSYTQLIEGNTIFFYCLSYYTKLWNKWHNIPEAFHNGSMKFSDDSTVQLKGINNNGKKLTYLQF